MSKEIQPLLFDVEECGLITCKNCDYGEWHERDILYREKGLSILYPCRRCDKCDNFSRWILKRKEIIIEEEEFPFVNQSHQEELESSHRVISEDDLFSISDIENENKKIVEKEHEEKNLKARESLELKRYENPKNENEMLFNFQYDYLKNNDEDSYQKLQEMASLVTERLIWKWMATHKLRLSSEEQTERCSIAVEYVLRRYKTRIGYCVTKNFITTLQKGVEHAMLYKTKLDENTDYIEDLKGLHL